MFCPSCGKEAPDNYKFCPSCGKSLELQATEPQPITPNISRPTGITILAVLQLIAGIFFTIAAIGIGAISSMGGMAGMRMSDFGAMAGMIGGFIAVILAIMAILAFIISGALFSGKRWGRTIVIIFSIIDLILEATSIAGGNMFGIGGIILDLVILYYMWRPHVIAYFHREL